MKKRATKIQISKRAAIQRINRKLAADQEMLKTCRGERLKQEVGRYYVIDLFHNRVAEKHIELEEFGRKLGVIAGYEEVDHA